VRDPEEGLIRRPPPSSLLARTGDRLAWYTSAVGLERWARLAAVAAVPLLLRAGSFDRIAPLFAALAAYVLLTALFPRDYRIRAADLLVSAGLIVLTGGQVVPFLLFLIVTVAGPASAGGVRAGVAAGGTLSFVLLGTLAWSGELPELGLGGALPAVLLLPLAGVTTAAAAQVHADRVAHDRLLLQEANRLLSSLRDLADELPGGLDRTTVSAAILAEIRTIDGVGAAIVYVEDRGLLQPVAASRFQPGSIPTLRVDELRAVASMGEAPRFLTPRGLPSPLLPLVRDHRHWAALGVGDVDSLLGVLLIGFDDLEHARQGRPRLASIASDGALALENARLFDGTQLRAADAARRRIAGDLHDGVAQSLAHIRMELELLARSSGEPGGGDAGRLARIAGSALEDLRATIGGLRRPLGGDLAVMIDRHLAEVRSPSGPDLSLAVSGRVELDPERTDDVLRIVQEAVSNALRHARAAEVTVSLKAAAGELTLSVEDDGIGPGGRSIRPGHGVGLRSMQERADRLGGELEVQQKQGGGTLVLLRCPLRDQSPRSARRPDPLRTGR
jgi:signal transduction histidine kinase